MYIVLIFFSFFAIFNVIAKSDDCTINDFSRVKKVITNCQDIVVSNLNVPAKSTLELFLNKGSTLIFEGETSFDYFEWKGPLVHITGDNLTVKGAPGSILNGKGELYWDSFGGNGGKAKPKFFRIEVNNSIIEQINLKNCPVHCVFIKSDNTVFNEWNIDVSDGDKNNFTGHNTDGFDVRGTNLVVKNSIVRNQDDCVAINQGGNVLVSNMSCYGGHGLSISVGFETSPNEPHSLNNLIFENSLVSRSPNGLHIKTHCDSGPGTVQNITYRNIRVEHINNFGLNIQQDYANGESTGTPGTNIALVDLKLQNITGYMESLNNSPTLEAQILCGEGSCRNWEFTDINITGAEVASNCTFVPPGYSC